MGHLRFPDPGASKYISKCLVQYCNTEAGHSYLDKFHYTVISKISGCRDLCCWVCVWDYIEDCSTARIGDGQGRYRHYTHTHTSVIALKLCFCIRTSSLVLEMEGSAIVRSATDIPHVRSLPHQEAQLRDGWW
mgnify:CR=1 FL=1